MAMAFGWGIRGQIGHERGAMLAGVLGALALVLVTPDGNKRRRLGWLCVAGGIGLSIGGSMSYGAVAGSLGKPGCGLLCTGLLLLKGAIWGGIGGGCVGMVMGDTRYRVRDLAWLFVAAALYVPASWWHPDGEWSRNDNTWGLLVVWVAFLVWLRMFKRDRTAFLAALLSGAGFGIGFPFGSWICVFGEHTGLPIDWWKIAEMSWGLCGGVSWGLAVYVTDEEAISPQEAGGTGANSDVPSTGFHAAPWVWPLAVGFVYSAWFVPLWNGLNAFSYWAYERHVLPDGAVMVYGLVSVALLPALVFWMHLSAWRAWSATRMAKLLAVWVMVFAFLVQFAKMAYPDGFHGGGFWLTQSFFILLMALIVRHIRFGVPRERVFVPIRDRNV